MDILDRIIILLGHKDQQELTDYLKLKKVAFSDWKAGKSKSYRKYLIEIAEFFNVSIDYLVYGVEKGSQTLELKQNEQKLLDNFNKLSDISKGRLLEKSENLVELEAKEKAESVEKENKPHIETVFIAARSSDNHPPEIVTGDFSEILNAPDVTDKY